MEVEIEATVALFDHVDGWQGRRRVLPMDIDPGLEEMPLAEEWVGGGQVLQSGRRLVWRSRGPKLEIAEVSGQIDIQGPRNGMELPFSVLSRDAICFEEVTDSRDECLVLWALTRNLVLHAVPFRPPTACGVGQHGRGNFDSSNSSAASLLASLPTREACDGVALNPPAGSEYPTCCSFVSPRDLLIGYGTGRLQIIHITRQRAKAGVGVGEGPHIVQSEVVRELPVSGYLSYLNPLAYRQAAQPPPSPVVALGGWAAGGGELLVFSLHADRRVRVWSTRSSKGVMLSELALPGAVDRGLLYADCSKVLVHSDAAVNRLVVSLTEPSHSRVWVSKPFSTAAEVEGWKDTHLAAHCFEENQLLADVCLEATGDGEEKVLARGRGNPPRISPQQRPPRRLRLWAALANDGLAYAPLETKKGGADLTNGSTGGNAADGDGGTASFIRLWRAPPSGLEDVGLLLGSAAGGGGEKGQGSNRRDALRQSLLALHERFGPCWKATIRHVEAFFLRFLAAPASRFSSMALVKAMTRIRSAPSLSGAGGQGWGGRGGRRGGHEDINRDPLPNGERLWEMVADVVRKEADHALAEAVQHEPRYQHQDEEEAVMVEDEKRALALLSTWVHFLDLAEQSREVLTHPLALLAGGDTSANGGGAVVAVRVDRCSTAVPVRLPMTQHLTFLDAFDEWMCDCAPDAVSDVNRCLLEALATTGQLPDPVLLKARAAEALQRRRPGRRLDAGLVLRGTGENCQTPIDLSTRGYQVVEEIEEVLHALRPLLQVLGETMETTAIGRRSLRRSQRGGAAVSSIKMTSSRDGGINSSNSSSSSRRSPSLATAQLAASAIGEILVLCLARLRTSLMLLVHLETAGMQQFIFRDPSEAPLTLQVATALNVAWLLLYSGSQPLLPPAPIRPPSVVLPSAIPRADARAFSILEGLILDLATPPPCVDAVQEVIQALCQSLPRRLLAYLVKMEQYRYLLPWARGLLSGALLLPFSSSAEGGYAEEKARMVATRRWQRLVVYAFLSEARRVSRREGQAKAAGSLFTRAIEALGEWDTCLTPPFVDNEEQGDERKEEGMHYMNDGEGGESGLVPRLAHYVQAVGLLEQSVGLPGCPPRRLADLAYAGLQHVPALPDSLTEGERTERERLKWCLQQAAALWATVFRACTDHTAGGTWQGLEDEEDSTTDTLAADAEVFEKAFLAMRAELAVARDLEEVTAHEDQEEEEEAPVGPVASRRSRNSKLSYLVVEMCERGRIDLLCSLPWAQGDAEDEVSEVEICLRSSARFSTIEEGEESDEAMDLASGGGGGDNVDYYKAAFAYLVSQSNFRMAALEMYRLAKRLEDATVYEDNLARLDRKVEALAAVHNCLCMVRDAGEYPFLLWTYDDKSRPPSSALNSTPAGAGSKKQYVVTLKRVEQELTYALAARQYLLVAGPTASPLRALSLSQAQAQPGAGEACGKLNKAAVHQVEGAEALLCGLGLFESAVALVRAFGLPMRKVVASLARTFAVLRGGRTDAPMVLEDGPRWNLGDPDEIQDGDSDKERSARLQVYIRLTKTLAEEGKEAKLVAEHAEAAGWLLKDLVQGYDWGHAYDLHTEAARYLLACDSFLEPPRWLTTAFTRGVDSRLVKTPQRKDKGGNSDQTRALGAWLDTGSSLSPVTRVPVTNSGAFLQMHVDKAMYILPSPGGSKSKVAGGRRAAAVASLPSETVLKESLHLLVRALRYGEEVVDTATNQLLTGSPNKVCLPRRPLLALLRRTQEVLELRGGTAVGDLAALQHQAELGLKNLRDRKLPIFDMQLRDKERMVALMLQQPR